MERLMTAYQEDLMSLDDLRRRMPGLRKREQAISAELNAIDSQLADRAGYLRLAETVTSFLARLRETAKTLDVAERQRIVRLLVKEILVDDDTIIIRHSIPAPTESTDGSSGSTSRPKGRQPPSDASYLLRKGGHHRTLPSPLATDRHDPVFQDACLEPFLDQADDASVADAMFHKLDEPCWSASRCRTGTFTKGYQLANVNLKANADVVSRIADALFARRFADRVRIEGDELAVLLAGAGSAKEQAARPWVHHAALGGHRGDAADKRMTQ
jgi:hypothetical protein